MQTWQVSALFVIVFGSTLFSLYLTYLEPFVIRAVCMWCLTSAVIMTLILLLSLGPVNDIFQKQEICLTRKSIRIKKDNQVPKILIALCVVIAVSAVLILKNQRDTQATSKKSPADLLHTATLNKQPILAFFHSNTCDSCLEMVSIVDQVYPEFADTITLVDVNVYDEQNRTLIDKVGLQFIPTLFFYDTSGIQHTHIGIMEADQLRKNLNLLSAGD